MNAAEYVVEAVRALQSGTGAPTIVIALDGFSASGKSTLAAAIADLRDAAVVHVDDFYRDMPEVERLALSPAEGVDGYFDWQRLRREALQPLKEHEPGRFRCFNWIAGVGLTDVVTVEPRELVIVEGVYAARPQFDDLLDLRVLVCAPDTERARRHRLRHDAHEWEERWEAAERVYFASIRPPTAFDLIVQTG